MSSSSINTLVNWPQTLGEFLSVKFVKLLARFLEDTGKE